MIASEPGKKMSPSHCPFALAATARIPPDASHSARIIHIDAEMDFNRVEVGPADGGARHCRI